MCTPLPPAGPQTHAEAPLLLRLWTARVPCRGHVLHPGELDLGGEDEVPRMGAEPRPGAGRSWGSRSRGRKSGDPPEGAVLPTSKREVPQSHLGSPAPRAPTGLSVLRARPDKVKHGQSGARLQQILSWKQN